MAWSRTTSPTVPSTARCGSKGGTNVRVIGNVLHSSVTGLEVTISKDLVIVDNEMYDNTVGLGLYHPSAASEPPLPVMEDWKVMNNYIHDNNQLFDGAQVVCPPSSRPVEEFCSWE